MSKKNYHQQYVYKNILIYILTVFILVQTLITAFSQEVQYPQTEMQGWVDSLVVVGDKLIAQGWAGAVDPSNKVVAISIWLGDSLVYDGGFKQSERPDVVKSMRRNDWLKSGWFVSATLPSNFDSGRYPVRVEIRLENGGSSKMVLSSPVDQIFIDENFQQSAKKIWKTRVLLIVLCVLLYIVFSQAEFFAEMITSKVHYLIKAPIIFGFGLLFFFFALLSLGVTGSSLRIGIQATPFVQTDEINIWGKDQQFRMDEYSVGTPLAIAQYNHHPQFPVVNKNLGEDGQNMLVVHGVPVAHITAIARPITWGFFLFDLKRALSWYWCFPIFACLFTLWGVTGLLMRSSWRSSFLIALWFVLSPYVAAWSNSPAYSVFFPSLALLSAIAILKSHNKYFLPTLGCILGVTLAGFVLLLYPPWQVSLAYVFLAMAVGIVIRDKLYKNFNIIRLSSFGLALAITGIILWVWWSDAHLAIQAMSATVYPGQRTMVTGGDVNLSTLLRGMTNLVTLHKLDSVYSNQCEIASFSLLLLPLFLLIVFRIYQKSIGTVETVLAIAISFILYFMLIGVPVEVAKFSLWSRVPAYRADIALGLSYIIICGILLAPGTKFIPYKTPAKILAFVVSMIWAVMALSSISRLHSSILSGFSPGITVGLFFVFVTAGYWLALGKFREFIYLNLALSVATIWPFNPINIAPQYITAKSSINWLYKKGSKHLDYQRILVLETQIPAMYLLASGLPVVNGIFYYPQSSLWERLDKNHSKSKIYNRYQHLIFTGGVVEDIDNYRIESPSADVVRVVVDSERFDFRKTGANLVTAPKSAENVLRKNTTLSHMMDEDGWSWFQIIGT